MKRTFADAVAHRRSYYAINNLSPISDEEIQKIVEFAVLNTPSAFNSQTARIVILLEENHQRVWNITMETLRKIVPADNFEPTEIKIKSFAAGHGTILFFEEELIVESLMKKFPLYAENFKTWSTQSSAMHQFVIWTMLEDAGLGASLQHYNELIAHDVQTEWSLPPSWKLIAQMPFGSPINGPGEKSAEPLESRVLTFK